MFTFGCLKPKIDPASDTDIGKIAPFTAASTSGARVVTSRAIPRPVQDVLYVLIARPSLSEPQWRRVVASAADGEFVLLSQADVDGFGLSDLRPISDEPDFGYLFPFNQAVERGLLAKTDGRGEDDSEPIISVQAAMAQREYIEQRLVASLS